MHNFCKDFKKFTNLGWAAFKAILARMWPMGHRLYKLDLENMIRKIGSNTIEGII